MLVVIAEALNAGRDMYLILTDPLYISRPPSGWWSGLSQVTPNPAWKKVTEDD